MSLRDGRHHQLGTPDDPTADTALERIARERQVTVDDLGGVIRAILGNTRNDMEERVRLVGTVLDLAQMAGIGEDG